MISIKLNLVILALYFCCQINAQTTTRASTRLPTTTTTSFKTTTTTSTTTRPTTVSTAQSNIRDFNSTSNVIYWEKCGLEARTRIVTIFQSSGNSNQHQFLYNPFSNSFIYRIVQVNQNLTLNEQSFELPFSIDGKTIFLLFDELDTINVYFGCPNSVSGSSSISINAPGISQVRSLELVQDSWLFPSFRDLLATFGCKSRMTAQSGSLIYFPSVQSSLENLPLISYNLYDVQYSLVLNRDGNVYLNGTGAYAKLNTRTLKMNSDIYFYFRNGTLELYDTCTTDRNQSLGVWFVPINGKFSIETSLEYEIGNGAVKVLLDAFCLIQRTSKSQILDDSVRLYQTYLPLNDILQQIEQFKSFLTIVNIGIDQLIQNEPKILIASRSNSKI